MAPNTPRAPRRGGVPVAVLARGMTMRELADAVKANGCPPQYGSPPGGRTSAPVAADGRRPPTLGRVLRINARHRGRGVKPARRRFGHVAADIGEGMVDECAPSPRGDSISAPSPSDAPRPSGVLRGGRGWRRWRPVTSVAASHPAVRRVPPVPSRTYGPRPVQLCGQRRASAVEIPYEAVLWLEDHVLGVFSARHA
jgi:hypothetical protein